MLMLTLLLALSAGSHGAEPNPPRWPETVHVFGPEDSAATNATVHAIYEEQKGADDTGLFMDVGWRCSSSPVCTVSMSPSATTRPSTG